MRQQCNVMATRMLTTGDRRRLSTSKPQTHIHTEQPTHSVTHPRERAGGGGGGTGVKECREQTMPGSIADTTVIANN